MSQEACDAKDRFLRKSEKWTEESSSIFGYGKSKCEIQKEKITEDTKDLQQTTEAGTKGDGLVENLKRKLQGENVRTV